MDPAPVVLPMQVNTATQSLETNIFGLQPPPRGLDLAAALLLPGAGELAVAVSNAAMQLYDLQRDSHVALLQVHAQGIPRVSNSLHCLQAC